MEPTKMVVKDVKVGSKPLSIDEAIIINIDSNVKVEQTAACAKQLRGYKPRDEREVRLLVASPKSVIKQPNPGILKFYHFKKTSTLVLSELGTKF